MKPLAYVVVLSATILIQAEHKEAKMESSRKSLDYQNLKFGNSDTDQEAQSSEVYHVYASLKDINHEDQILENSEESILKSEEDGTVPNDTSLKFINNQHLVRENTPKFNPYHHVHARLRDGHPEYPALNLEEAAPKSKVEALFPYELYSKIKLTLPALAKSENRILMPVYVDKPVPVKILIDEPFPVEKRVPVYYPVKINKPYLVNKYVPVPVRVNVPVQQKYPVYKDVPVPVHVYVDKPVPKFVDQPYPVPVFRKKVGLREIIPDITTVKSDSGVNHFEEAKFLS